jgi:hypothetical protein
MENIENLVYWYIKENDVYFEGVITKDEYDYLNKSNKKGSFCYEIAKYDYIECDFEELKFSTDKDDIINFLNSQKRTNNFSTIIRCDLTEYIEDNNSD